LETFSNGAISFNYDTEEELVDSMLMVAGFTRDSFALYMGIEPDYLAKNPLWVKRYLIDTISLNLEHLGYVMEDSRQKGMLSEYEAEVQRISEKALGADHIQQPIIINSNKILSKDGILRISILSNITSELKNI